MTTRARTLQVLVVLGLAAGLAACGSSDSASGGGSSKLSLVAYSTPKEAYEQIIPAFEKTPAGAGTSFTQSYGNSGDQARAIISGLPADVAALSLEPDITKLVKDKLVVPGWKSTPTKGIVTRSVVALSVRPGNPKHITGWADLVKPGIEVLTPNPFTSGGARWNVMAAYGAQIQQGRSEAQATDYLQRLFKNVVVQDKSAREALQSFTSGKGDVLISYENEAITARQKGEKLDYVIPDETILEGAGLRQIRDLRAGAEDLRCQGLPVGDPVARRQDDLSRPAEGVHHHEVRWLGRGDEEVLRPAGLGHAAHRQEPRCQHRLRRSRCRAVAGGGAAASRRRRSAARSRRPISA
jgi:sulfate/thiosulfate-binding protein